jgi:hypothetical protein
LGSDPSIQPIGAYSLWCCGNGRYAANVAVHYQTCVLRVKPRGHLPWQGFQLASGFDVELTYEKNVRVTGENIGLNDDFDLTQPLARFLFLNQDRIHARLQLLETALANYRAHHKKEAHAKHRVLTYRFQSLYDEPREPKSFSGSAIELESDLRVKQLISGNDTVFQSAYERLSVVSNSQATRWWYIFWVRHDHHIHDMPLTSLQDDLWRRNYNTISALRRHAPDFNPHYPTSIAYTPLPRPALEAFLVQRGLLSKVPKWGYFFHSGFLNKLYLRLNDAVFGGSSQVPSFSFLNSIHSKYSSRALCSTLATVHLN